MTTSHEGPPGCPIFQDAGPRGMQASGNRWEQMSTAHEVPPGDMRVSSLHFLSSIVPRRKRGPTIRTSHPEQGPV